MILWTFAMMMMMLVMYYPSFSRFVYIPPLFHPTLAHGSRLGG